MNHVATAVRSYRSELREQQAKETRRRILDATVRVMATGLANVSVPAVAREAGVSVPTVYRHFGSKEGLFAAVYPHVVGRTSLPLAEPPQSIDELREAIRQLFERFDTPDDLVRAAMASPAADEVRRAAAPDRVAVGGKMLQALAPSLKPGDRDRLARLLAVLVSSSAFRMWRHIGASVDVAADDIEWLIRTVTERRS